MAQSSRPWSTTGTGDGTITGYTADQWATSWRHILRAHSADRGVIVGYGNSLSVSNPAGSTIRVPTGAAIVHGVWYENTAQADYTPGDGTYPALPTDNQIHRVVLRKNWTAQTVRIAFISGTDAVAPTTPSLTQSDGATWEIPLAQFQVSSAGAISSFTDQRVNVGETLVFIGDVANANMTAGLTINQAGADDHILTLKSSDVAHGVTAVAETDTYGFMRKFSGVGGGLQIVALTDADAPTSTTPAFSLYAVHGVVADTTKGTAAIGVITLDAVRANGTGVIAVAADGNLLCVRNSGSTRFILDAEGTLHPIIGDADIDIIRLSGTTGTPAFAWNETRDRFTLSKGLELTAGMLFVGDTVNIGMTVGLTLNQGSAGDEILTLKQSGVAHAVTTITETDTYGFFKPAALDIGGLHIEGLADADQVGTSTGALELVGTQTVTADTTKTTAGMGVLNLVARLKNGTGVTTVGADGNLAVIRNSTTTRFIFDAEGTIHSIGASFTDQIGNGLWFINDTSNAKMTIGLTINQGAAGDEILAFKNSGVVHGMTDVTETDTFAYAKVNTAAGGLILAGLSESTIPGITLDGIVTTDVTDKTVAANGAFHFMAEKRNLLTTTAMGADGNLLTIANLTNTRFIFDAEGTIHSIGASYTDSMGNGLWFINDTANTKMTVGLTLNQGTNDNEILALKSSTDVDHGMTDLTETDTYGTFTKFFATQGGLVVGGYSEGYVGIEVQGSAGLANTTKDTTAVGAVQLDGRVKSIANVASLGANGNIVVVSDNGTARFILDADGDSHQDVGTAWTNFDDYDDSGLLTALSVGVSRHGDPIQERFGHFLHDYRPQLEAARLVTFNEDGHHFVNMSRLSMLLVGAVRQLSNRLQIAEQRLSALPSPN